MDELSNLVVIVLVTPLFLLAFIVFFMFTTEPEQRPLSPEFLLLEWASAEFVSIDDLAAFNKVFSERIDRLEKLTEKQKVGLENTLIRLLRFSKTGEPGDFLDYRVPHGSWEFAGLAVGAMVFFVVWKRGNRVRRNTE